MAGIGTHLQRQRPHAAGRITRGKQRSDRRGYPDDGIPWGQSGWAPGAVVVTPSTGATAGIPGTWTPGGSTRPTTVAALQGGVPVTVVANPATGWTAGQFVQTQETGSAGRATWTGTSWVGGIAPGILTLNIPDVQAYVTSLPMDGERASIIQALLDEERADRNRTTLVSWLDQQLGVE